MKYQLKCSPRKIFLSLDTEGYISAQFSCEKFFLKTTNISMFVQMLFYFRDHPISVCTKFYKKHFVISYLLIGTSMC